MNDMTELMRQVRRRLRIAWALATGQMVAPLVAAAAVLLVLLGRWFPLAWSERAAWIGAISAAVAIVGFAALSRIPPTVVARAADRGLRTKDAFASSLEFRDGAEDLHGRIHRRAADLAGAAAPRQAVPFRLRPRPVAIGTALGVAAVVLALIANPQDARRAQQARDRALIEDTAEALSAEAERLAQQPGADAAAERLERLAEELARTEDLATAEELLDDAAAELRSEVEPDLLSKKAASEGLSRSLEQTPLPGAAPEQSSSEQMEAMADQLDSMTDEELQEAAERLDDLADTQQAGDPATADALRAAADSLRAGDVSAARARLGEAGQAAATSAGDVDAQSAASDAADAADAAGDRIGNRAGQGSGQPGDGNGDGDGDGDGDGNGNGTGTGTGNGGGQGQGQGGGSPNGNVGGGGGGTQGQGGQGQGTGTNGAEEGQLPDTSTIYDPARESDGTGEVGSVGGGDGSGDGGTIGTTNGQTNDGQARVPVNQAIDDYAREATDAMNNPEIPPAVRALVLAYFDQLQGNRQPAAGD